MITKSGEVCYRSRFSRCQKCSMFIKDPYQCWIYDMIPYRIWENIIGYECDKFNSILKDQCNNCFVFRDYENRDLFPEKKFGGQYRFDKFGNRIGKQ